MVASLGERIGFLDVLKFDRVAIAGGPRTGKTTLAMHPDRCARVIHTDEIKLPWSEIPREIVRECHNSRAYVVEGVQVGRALRKGLTPQVVVYLNKPLVSLTKGQASMSRACATIFRSWLDTNSAVPAYLLSSWEAGGLPEFSRIF